MLTSKFSLDQIVVGAISLSEYLNNSFFQVNNQLNKQDIHDERLDRWCQVIAQGNWEKFHKRLQWDGLDIDKISPIITSSPCLEGSLMPQWANTLKEIIETARDWNLPKKINYEFLIFNNLYSRDKMAVDPDEPLPFEDILLPAVFVARQKLLSELELASLSSKYSIWELITESAYMGLERSLLHKLVNICEKTLITEFSGFRPLGISLLNRVIGKEDKESHKDYYNNFVNNLLQDGLLSFFEKYPVLGRLVATQIDFWVESTSEFLQRLKADISAIKQSFFYLEQPIKDEVVAHAQLGKVIDIQPGLSDPHHQARSVIILTFASEIKLVYKPKDLGLEVAYNQFLDWCNQQDIPLNFKVLKVLNRKGYGWIEYVEQLPCEDQAAAQRFYQRAGMLLSLLYTLGCTDCHQENLIANGEHLVLVDMETLLHHETRFIESPLESTEAETGVIQNLWESVLRTGLLPRWKFNKDNRIAYDISGLGSFDPQQSTKLIPDWKSVNTAYMHLGYKKVTNTISQNVPTLNGVALVANDYLEELVEGFQQMYRFLLKQREALLAVDSPLKVLKGQQVRFVFRATSVYGMLLEKTLSPEFLRNGIDRSIELDVLSRAFLIGQNKPTAWPVFHSELRAMEQLDIPYFAASSDSDFLTIGLEQAIPEYFQKTSYQQVIEKLQSFNERDLAQQVAIIQGAFYARVARKLGADQKLELNKSIFKTTDYSHISPLSNEQLLQEANRIAQEIQKRAFSTASGNVNWIGLNYVPNAERFQLKLLDNNLYDGNCGIVLFLAALDYIQGTTYFRDLNLNALEALRKFLQPSNAELNQRFATVNGIGGAVGLGSIIYSLVKIHHFIPEASLLEDAQRAANLISPQVITTDQRLDVMAGAAGAILGLLALYSQTNDAKVLDKAQACGQHLLKQRTSIGDRLRAWKTLGNKPLTGFSHGAAGIAYALVRLYEVTKDRDYLEAAEEGIAYERSVFSPENANWPDFRFASEKNSQLGYMNSWCHGASGIGLARLGSLSIFSTEDIDEDINVALKTTNNLGLQIVDNLCCGNFGRIEMLLLAGQKLQLPQWREIAQKQAAMAIAKAQSQGTYQLFGNLPGHVFNPGFFQGYAGIGYELIRLADPELIPSVLLWE